MQIALRKIGDAMGVVLPRAILEQAGLTNGTVVNVSIDGDKIILAPAGRHPREGWEEAAAAIADFPDPEAQDWLDVPNEVDASLRW